MKKVIAMLCISTSLFLSLATPASAMSIPEGMAKIMVTTPSGEESSVFIDLKDCSVIRVDDAGTLITAQPRTILTKHTIAAGNGNYYRDSSGNTFYFPKGAKVTFSVNLANSASIGMGYICTSEVIVAEFTGTSHTTTFYAPETGGYSLVLRNRSSYDATVTDGRFTY